MRIWVKPAGKGQFFYYLRGDWYGPTGTPLLDAARELLARGRLHLEVIEMWHEGAETWALRSTVGKAARLRVDEDGPRFRKWEPMTDDRMARIRGARG